MYNYQMKDMVIRFTVPEFKFDYKATVILTMQLWNGISIDQNEEPKMKISSVWLVNFQQICK